MSEQATTTTPDPEFFATQEETALPGDNVRGEVPGCPTGMARPGQVESVQRAGGGGAPTTGTTAPASPGEGVTDEQVRRSGLDDPAK